METKDFYYDLPKELIAQTPVEPRDSSRLLVMNKTSGELEHRHFYDITEYLQPGDCLIVNDSRVLPARNLRKQKRYRRSHRIFIADTKRTRCMGSACKTGKDGTARHMVCVWRRLAGSSGAGNFGRWKEIGSFSLSGEFFMLC